MFKKKDKEEEQRKKEKKQQMKQAKKEAKEKAQKAKEDAKRKKIEEQRKAIERKQNYIPGRQPKFNNQQMVGKANDIWEAAKTGNLLQIQEYIAQGMGIGARDSNGATALHHAASSGHIPCLQWILALQKIDVDVQDRWGMTPLHKAVFAKQLEAAEWLVLRGADLHILTEGGISPLEKAFEYGEEFAAALLTKSVQVEENGILVEEKIEVYGDVEVKWGDKTIYVDRQPHVEEPVMEEPIIEEEIPQPELTVQQQRGMAAVHKIAQEGHMQEALIKGQLKALEEENDVAVIPELRDPIQAAPAKPRADTVVRTESSYDILTTTKRAKEKAAQFKDVPMEFSKRFDKLTASATHFIYALMDNENSEDYTRKLNVSLKSIVVALQGLFQIMHPFANTKFDATERGKVLKGASELQLSVQNLVQAVKSRNNALPQFIPKAQEKLIYHSQILVASVWNTHVAAELISNDNLQAQIRESGAVYKEVLSCALGQSSQSFTEIICYSKLQSLQTILLVNCKVIEIYNSNLQQSLAETSFTISKATRGLLMAAEKVKEDVNSPHKDTMAKLAKLILFNINKLCEHVQDPNLYQMYNFLDEDIEKEIIFDICNQLTNCVDTYSNKNREIHNEEVQILQEIRKIIVEIKTIFNSIQPQTYSKFDIIACARRISASQDIIATCALQYLSETASELLENYLITSLKSCMYFSNQVKIVAASMSVSYAITTKIMLPLSIRYLGLCLISATEAIDKCVTIFDNPLDFDMDAILDSLPTTAEEVQFGNTPAVHVDMPNMKTIRSTKSAPKSNIQGASQLARPVANKKKTALSDMATIRQPRREPVALNAPQSSNIPPSTMNELDELVNIERHPNLQHSKSQIVMNELDALVNFDNIQQPEEAKSSFVMDELDALVNIERETAPQIPNNDPIPQNIPDDLDALVNIGRAPSSPYQSDSTGVLDELDALVNIDSRAPSSPMAYSNQSTHTPSLDELVNLQSYSQPQGGNDLDELDALVNIDSSNESYNTPLNTMISGYGSNNSGIDALDELEALVNSGSSETPNQPTIYNMNMQSSNSGMESNVLDELDSLVNIDSSSIHTPSIQSFEVNNYGSQSSNVEDDLDYLLNSAPTPPIEIDPMDELSSLVNISSTSYQQPQMSINYQSNNSMNSGNQLSTATATPTANQWDNLEEVDSLAELESLVNIGNSSNSFEQDFGMNLGIATPPTIQSTSNEDSYDPLDELDALVNL